MSARFIYTAVVVPATVVIPLTMGALRYRRFLRPQRVLFYYLLFGGIIGGVAAYYAKHRMNNLWLLHTYTGIETVLLLWFYRSVIVDVLIRKVIPYLMVFFPLVCVANILWWQSLTRFNTYTRPVEALMMIFMGLVVFLENSHTPADRKGGPQMALSWINAGLLLYFSVSLFYFLFSNFLHPDGPLNTFMLVSHATFVLVMYLLITMGFYKCSR